MADSVKISIDTSQYRLPTQEEMKTAKQFVLRRDESAGLMESRIDMVLQDAQERIIIICYKYNVKPDEFEISKRYNELMMNEISEVMDEVEEEILAIIEEYATAVTTDKKRVSILLAWMLLLGRRNRNLRQTLNNYLNKFLKDLEAAVAAMRFAKIPLAQAITKAKTHLHTIYTMPEVMAAFKQAESFTATYIRNRGVAKGNVGLSNNGSTNVTNMANITLQMVWMRSQAMDFKEQGAVGYYQLRGSNYICDICDDEVGFHLGVADIYLNPLPHPRCACYRIPIYRTENK